MTLHDDVCRLAFALCQKRSEEEQAVLATLCAAAEAELQSALRDGITPEDCRDSFCCAAAWLATERFTAGMDADGVRSFTAGNVSVSRTGGAGLQKQALQMLAPYLSGSAAFLGVRG